MAGVMNRLAKVGRRNTSLSPRQFETSTNSQGTLTEIASLTADTPLAVRTGRHNPLRLAIPAYESFETAGDGSTQTFSLTYDVIESPDTQDVVIWFDGDYQGQPASVDYDADQITVDGPSQVVTVHTYYVPGNAASLELRKKMPGAKTSTSERLYEANLGLVHNANQAEQPEYVTLNESELQRFLASDMDLEVRVDAPYQVRWEDPDGDGTEPTNALLQIPAQKADNEVEGLGAAISADMGER